MWKTKRFGWDDTENKVADFLTSLPRESAEKAKITYNHILREGGYYVVFYPLED